MKAPESCAKCGGAHSVVRVPGGAGGKGAGSLTIGILSAVPLTAFVCTVCGYVELGIEHVSDREEVARKFGRPESAKGKKK